MSAMLPGLAPPGSLRLDVPVWGIDTSTKRMAAAALIPGRADCGACWGSGEQQDEGDYFRCPTCDGVGTAHGVPDLRWDTLSLPSGATLAYRQSLAVREMIPWLHGLRDRWGKPGVVGIEAPLAGGNTPLPSFYVVGALYVALGTVFGVEVEVIEFSPGEWKKLATGYGYAPGLPKSMPKAQKRQAEKARLIEWARGAGYTGWLDDEADGIGVVTATGIRVEQRTRGAA